SGLKLSRGKLNAGDSLEAEVDVRNISQLEGDEVIELYLSFPKLPGAPLRALRGFQRIHLVPGEKRRVRLTLDARDLSLVNEAGDRIVAPGKYKVSVGGGQPGTGASAIGAKFTVRRQQSLPD
ncbi:MAG: fibronectin type III-like domain-contianing protein, partial [Burkholderiales bacterium]